MKIKEYSSNNAILDLSKNDLSLIIYALIVADYHNKKDNTTSDKLASDLEKLFDNIEHIGKLEKEIPMLFKKGGGK